MDESNTNSNSNISNIIPDFVTVLKDSASKTEGKKSGRQNFKLLLLLGIAVVILVSIVLVIYAIFFRGNGTTNTNVVNTSTTSFNSNLPLQDVNATGTLRIWGLWEKEADFEAIIIEFNKKYPNVKVEYSNRETINNGDTQKYRTELIQRIVDSGSNTSPDIFMIHSNWTDSMVKYSQPMPNTVYTAEEYKNIFYQTFTDLFTAYSDKKIYAVPMSFDGLGLYYNKRILGAKGYTVPAENWEDFKKQVLDLSGRTADGTMLTAGVSAGSINNVSFGFDLLSLLLIQNGTTMTSADGKTILFGESDQAAEAMKFYSDLGNVGRAWDADQPQDVRLFAEGKLAFMFAPAWRADAIKKSNVLLDFDVAPVPQLPNLPAGSRVDLASYWGFSVSKSTKNSSLAWTFLKFLSEKDGYRALYNKTSQSRYVSQVYPRRDLASEQSSIPFLQAFIKMAPTARSWKMYDRERIDSLFRSKINTGIAKGVSISLSGASAAINDIAKEMIKDIPIYTK
jgi:ABC-type glycerol-3-phosphate transport system substrate-binding protein